MLVVLFMHIATFRKIQIRLMYLYLTLCGDSNIKIYAVYGFIL
jgi:hypothetical protein